MHFLRRVQQKLLVKQIYNMSRTAQQFELMKKQLRQHEAKRHPQHKLKTVNTIKWKTFMLETLANMANNIKFDPKLLHNLHLIIESIKEENFIEAIINLQPFKQTFKIEYSSQPPRILTLNQRPTMVHKYETSPGKDGDQITTNCASSFSNGYNLKQKNAQKKLKEKLSLISQIIKNKMLDKELSSQSHPYFKIIEGFTTLTQNKYKQVIDKMFIQNGLISIQEIVDKLSIDMNLLETFFKLTAYPIFDIFNIKDNQDKKQLEQNFNHYMLNYLRNHEKLCQSFKKIVKYGVKHSSFIKKIQKNCADTPDIDNFQMDQKFKIEGYYVYTTNQLIQFSEVSKGGKSLSKLVDIRNSISKDIDEYYKQEPTSVREVNSEFQLEILKFMLTKLKVFAIQIYSQIKLLEILFGQQEMAFVYDDASYIHSQLSIAYEALELNL